MNCTCAPMTRRRHAQRLSGPLIDRIDLRVQVDPVAHADLFDITAEPESSAVVAARVLEARCAAAERWRGTPYTVNAAVPGSILRTGPWQVPPAVLRPARRSLEQGSLSARGFDRVLRLAWTAADLGGRTLPNSDDVADALYFRTGQDTSWAA
jgi:magnesium chelatase family protein